MFSQFRQAVEHLAQQVPNGLDISLPEDQRDSASRSRSVDLQPTRSAAPLSSGQLAESALSSLRKSLASQRPGSPAGRTGSSSSLPESRTTKGNLEERLRRATFAIGEASGPSTAQPSVRASPSPTPRTMVQRHLLSPASTPLPDSPMLTPTIEGNFQLDPVPVSPPSSTLSKTDSPLSQPERPEMNADPNSETLVSQEAISVLDEASTNFEPSNITASNRDTLPSNDEDLADDKEGQVGDTSLLEEAPQPRAAIQNSPNSNVEDLQERLRQVEQRFADVSTSFKRLQAEKMAADLVLRDLTSLQSIQDAAALRDHLEDTNSKAERYRGELQRLNERLESYDGRLQELQEAHQLESSSQSELVNKLKTQLNETEALFQASQSSTTQAEETAATHRSEVDHLTQECERFKTLAKEEEEKRVKAISLLKSVRQKLVKAEKEKEDALKEAAFSKERERGERDKEHVESARLHQEIEALNKEREKVVSHLKGQHEKDVANLKDRFEKELSAVRGQLELEMVTSKSVHTKELSAKNSQISTLENSLNNITRDKNAFFDQLQLRQAELESAQTHLESLQHQNTEFQFQLRESNDRLALLREEYAESQREQEATIRQRDPVTPASDVAHLISATEAKYEAKISELKRNFVTLEKERNEAEGDWSRKLREKGKELDELKRVLGSAAKTREADEGVVSELNAEVLRAKEVARVLRQQLSELPLLRDQVDELKKSAKEQETELALKISYLERQVEEGKNRDAQLRQNNKTLREELRKVQSSAALLERQRNPGVGYWTTRNPENSPAESRNSFSPAPSESPSRVASPTPSSSKNEEEVNLEYLRNVILQFLEHKEMRPNLVKVLSIILHFTPQETRRLIAKV